MFQNNKELRVGLMLIIALGIIFSTIGFTVSMVSGFLILAVCLVVAGIHLGTEFYRYRRLQKLSSDLDELLNSGIPLPIRD